MNVVIVGSSLADSLEQHLCDSFRVLGHAAFLVDTVAMGPVGARGNYWLSRFVGFYDRLIGRQLAGKIVSHKPDLVLVVYRCMNPILVEQVKAQLPTIPIIQLNPDALSNLEKQQIIAADFDYYFSKEPYIVEALRHKAGLNAHYLPEGFNPRYHQKPPIEKAVAEWLTDIDVLVFGSLYAYRVRMIEQLIRAGIKVVVYGTKGPYMRPGMRTVFQRQRLTGQSKNRLLYAARIVFNNLHYAEVTSVNQKYFEINGIGGFQLCDYKPTVDSYTGVPADLVTYRTMDDAIDKIRYYLARPARRHELAAQQYAHFQAHHTFDQRVSQLLQTVGLMPPINLKKNSATD